MGQLVPPLFGFVDKFHLTNSARVALPNIVHLQQVIPFRCVISEDLITVRALSIQGFLLVDQLYVVGKHDFGCDTFSTVVTYESSFMFSLVSLKLV